MGVRDNIPDNLELAFQPRCPKSTLPVADSFVPNNCRELSRDKPRPWRSAYCPVQEKRALLPTVGERRFFWSHPFRRKLGWAFPDKQQIFVRRIPFFSSKGMGDVCRNLVLAFFIDLIVTSPGVQRCCREI